MERHEDDIGGAVDPMGDIGSAAKSSATTSHPAYASSERASVDVITRANVGMIRFNVH